MVVFTISIYQGRVAQSVMCLTVDLGVASLIPAPSHTFVKIDHAIISRAILLPSTESRRVVVSYRQKYVCVLVYCLVKLAKEKVWLGELTGQTWP